MLDISEVMKESLFGPFLNEYYDFIEQQIERKKNRIERELDT
ncbi:hypothetical protein [Marinobacterium stanieri]|uniref:Uncharacterized protein n=1 Tax=Marinobacterium stanieri TaxID=49186 RepID=A0A1N6UQ88_9GAMM|nr:hypothetical protein [Marinobacterium stanieri]SIQ67631.1 hypothetical protein SAMN05421647_107148 [Marinobacterium stanieri]